MTDLLIAEFDALTRVAATQRDSRNSLIRIQHQRRDAVLDPGALGKILPARELLETFRAVNRATRERLWDVTQRCEVLSDAVRETRNDFREVDAEVARSFRLLMGGQP